MKKTRFEEFCDLIKEEVTPIPYNDTPGKSSPMDGEGEGIIVARVEREGGECCDVEDLLAKVMALSDEDREYICQHLQNSFGSEEGGEEEFENEPEELEANDQGVEGEMENL